MTLYANFVSAYLNFIEYVNMIFTCKSGNKTTSNLRIFDIYYVRKDSSADSTGWCCKDWLNQYCTEMNTGFTGICVSEIEND